MKPNRSVEPPSPPLETSETKAHGVSDGQLVKVGRLDPVVSLAAVRAECALVYVCEREIENPASPW